MKRTLQVAGLSTVIYLPLALWLQPPWYAAWSLAMVVVCLVKASL